MRTTIINCDVCLKQIEVSTHAHEIVIGHGKSDTHEICLECLNELRSWLFNTNSTRTKLRKETRVKFINFPPKQEVEQ